MQPDDSRSAAGALADLTMALSDTGLANAVIADVLVDMRRDAHMTQASAARASGVHEKTIAGMEAPRSGRACRIRLMPLLRLCSAYNVSLWDFEVRMRREIKARR